MAKEAQVAKKTDVGNVENRTGRVSTGSARASGEEGTKKDFLQVKDADLQRQINENKHELEQYLGGGAEITSIDYRYKVSIPEENGKVTNGVLLQLHYLTQDPYNPNKKKKNTFDVVIDSNGYARERSTYYPSYGANLHVEYGAPLRKAMPSFNGKFK